MAFTRFPDPTNNISNLANQPVEPPATLKQKFDQFGEDSKDWTNNVFLPELESTTNGDSGADNIGATALSGGVATTVQGVVEELDAKIDSLLPFPDGSITDAKLSNDTTALKQRFANLNIVNIMNFGAIGDGVTNDTTAFQNAINSLSSGGVLVIPQNKTIKFTNVLIENANINICGGGSVLDGKISIGHASEQRDLNFEIFNISIKFTTLVSGNIGISLKNTRIGRIYNCNFVNCDKAIYVEQYDFNQHTSKIMISNNIFNYINYCLYVDKTPTPSVGVFWSAGDFHFINNQAFRCYITHIKLLYMDGIVIKGNTLFFPGYTLQNTTKEHNIRVDFGTWIIIEGNNLFEAGFESIKLVATQKFSVSNNNFAWPGQRELRSAIEIAGGDAYGTPYNNGVISNNVIDEPTLYGIRITTGNGLINIGGNIIKNAGGGTYYYGSTPIGSVSHYGFANEATVSTVNILGNITPDNTNVYGTATRQGNSEKGFIKPNARTRTFDTTATTIDVTNFERVNLAQPSPTSISTITADALAGDVEVTFYGFNANTTFVNSSTIRLKGLVDATVPIRGTITFTFHSGNWWEKSRSF